MSVYHTVVADPPWRFNDKLPGKGRGADKHYETMTIEEIRGYQFPEAADDTGPAGRSTWRWLKSRGI